MAVAISPADSRFQISINPRKYGFIHTKLLLETRIITRDDAILPITVRFLRSQQQFRTRNLKTATHQHTIQPPPKVIFQTPDFVNYCTLTAFIGNTRLTRNTTIRPEQLKIVKDHV
jgi:hypothetical protein